MSFTMSHGNMYGLVLWEPLNTDKTLLFSHALLGREFVKGHLLVML